MGKTPIFLLTPIFLSIDNALINDKVQSGGLILKNFKKPEEYVSENMCGFCLSECSADGVCIMFLLSQGCIVKSTDGENDFYT